MRLLERHDRPAADRRRPETQARIDGRRRTQRLAPLKMGPAPDTKAALAGQVAVVTGGAGGIGAAIARTLAVDGASVAVVDVNEPVFAAETRIRAWRCDVTRPAEIIVVCNAIETALG